MLRKSAALGTAPYAVFSIDDKISAFPLKRFWLARAPPRRPFKNFLTAFFYAISEE